MYKCTKELPSYSNLSKCNPILSAPGSGLDYGGLDVGGPAPYIQKAHSSVIKAQQSLLTREYTL